MTIDIPTKHKIADTIAALCLCLSPLLLGAWIAQLTLYAPPFLSVVQWIGALAFLGGLSITLYMLNDVFL